MGSAWQCSWTDAQVALLKSLWLDGITGGEIGRRLGISRSAAMGKLRREGMLRQDRPKMPIMARSAAARNLLKTTEQVSKPPKKPRIRTNKRPLPPPEPYQAPPRPPDPPIGSFDLLQLRHGHCRWPEGERAPYRFCGRSQAVNSSYCLPHAQRAMSSGKASVPHEP